MTMVLAPHRGAKTRARARHPEGHEPSVASDAAPDSDAAGDTDAAPN